MSCVAPHTALLDCTSRHCLAFWTSDPCGGRWRSSIPFEKGSSGPAHII
ncbi:hypothetical protein PCL1606_25980 [Pseudomonas chlororaphis]|uniref:Uncharacterized protein n=1 Tax=Pseudomonas chlororaphis TaxID=587753 RepID=A0A0D5XY74_9PSED|nr:hypothetical protein PCL1606_25980 [Pseudomonas chlororaphis]